jgi:putative ABC transport system permease protein
VPGELLARLQAQVGDKIPLVPGSSRVQGGPRVTIVGLLADTGAAIAHPNDEAYTSHAFAQELFGIDDRLTSIEVALRDGVATERWIAANRDLFPGALALDVSFLDDPARDALDGVRRVLRAISLVSILVSAAIVYTVTRIGGGRDRVLGILRTLGTSRQQLAGLLAVEATFLAVAGAVGGCLAGLLAARTLIGRIAARHLYEVPALAPSPVGLAVACALAAGLALLAAFSTMLATSFGVPGRQDLPGGRNVTSRFTALLGTAAVLSLIVAAARAPRGSASLVLLGGSALLLGGLVVLPRLTAPTLRLVLAPVRWLSPRLNGLGLHPMILSAGPKLAPSITMAAIVIALLGSFVFARGAVDLGARRLLEEEYRGVVQVTSPRLDPEVVATVAGSATAGATSAVQEVRVPGVFADRPSAVVDVRIVEPATYFDVVDVRLDEPGDRSVADALAGGDALLVPRSMARELGAEVNGAITLRARDGDRDFRVAATYRSATGAALVMSRDGWQTHFGDFVPNRILARAVPAGRGATLAGELSAELAAGGSTAAVARLDEVEPALDAATRDLAALYLGVLLTATALAMASLSTAIALVMRGRREEHAVLTALGATSRTIMWLAWIETASLVVTAAVLAVPLGIGFALLGVAVVEVATGLQAIGPDPAGYGLQAVAGVVLLALVAAVCPVVTASRVSFRAAQNPM